MQDRFTVVNENSVTQNNENCLRKIHAIQLKMMDEVHKICLSHRITYYMFGGTLIGAIRHKGFIPWDDDIDIAMPRNDFEKFREIANKYFPDDIRFWTARTDYGIGENGRIIEEDTDVRTDVYTKVGMEHQGVWIDVFPLDEVREPNSFFTNFQVKILYSVCNRLTSIQRLKYENIRSKKGKLLKKVIGDKKNTRIVDFRDWVCKWQNGEKSKYYVAYGSHYYYKKQMVPKEKYGVPHLMQFEDRKYFGPSDYDYILNQVYGDYMKIPERNKRETHNIEIRRL